MARFVVEWEYFEDGGPRAAARPAHRDYLDTLVEAGKVLGAGPWVDDSGALLVYEVADRAELDALLAADPFTTAGVVAGTRVHEWKTLKGPWAG
ncbi:hypothetical protein GCM10022243_52160 [Saccharothrix violaceirubra]|uniref:YCII-related domain-containing protein n=1 Tax=Saccharothrix violaceirubra TaxID=413306 RepID=A0A7W7X034_9PSEU|nr:YciI family protein [Saccharothrix violaceirubra]MBB4969483.1 hypothetical protein [Saccharothrix violaceirubra]